MNKFKPPKSFTSVRRDQPSPVLPSKRLSSDPETPPPSSTIQSKRPRCYTGSEKENQPSQQTPFGGVTNFLHRLTPVPSQQAVECIDVDRNFPSSSNHPSDLAFELSGVSRMENILFACVQQPSGNQSAAPKSCRGPEFHSRPPRSSHPERVCTTCGVPIRDVRTKFFSVSYLA